jgi:MFS family permease
MLSRVLSAVRLTVLLVAYVCSYYLAVIKPPIGKVADVFGRLEAFTMTIFFYTIGYILQASSHNVQTFASAQIFWAAGFNGVQVLQQIFVADTSDLLNRALYSTLFDLPFLWTVWAGPEVGEKILATISWRWGYGIWAIILPICFIPLFISLFMNQRRAKKLGHDMGSPIRGRGMGQVIKNFAIDIDLFGLLLFSAAVSLILLPLTLAPRAKGQWNNESMIAMLVIGAVCLLLFPFWETSKKLAPRAFFPSNLFKQRTVVVGSLIAFFYFSKHPQPTTSRELTITQWHSTCPSSPTSNRTSRSSKVNR